ncbi:CHASE2 domain-containing protein [Candidatus Kapabacteria bacterium]|nr:CHASE2 domain-containing protein [Candidatus Kapabacteria bacterium]
MLSKIIDHILSTLLVIALLKFLPVFFNLDMFDPVQGTLEQMQVSDIAFGHIRDYDNYDIDTNIIIVNNGHLNRKQIAAMIEIINQYEPKVVAIDAMFRADKGDDMDVPLQNAFKKTNKLVLAVELYKNQDEAEIWDTVKTSNSKFNTFAMHGYVNMYEDPDNFRTVRMITTQQSVNDDTLLSFSAKTVMEYNPELATKYLKRNNETEVINFKRNIDKYKTYNYTEIFEQSEELENIKGKIILIGYLGPEPGLTFTEDIFFTPMNPKYVGKSKPDMYGVVVHANVMSMILEEDFIFKFPSWFKNFLLVSIVLLNMVMFRYFRTKFFDYYQPLTIFAVLGQLVLYSTIIVSSLHLLDIEIKLGNTFFAILVCVLCFETYTDSLKPIVMGWYRSIRFNRKRKDN